AYLPVASILDDDGGAAEVRAINLVEYAGDDAPTIDARVAALVASIDAMTGPDAPSGATVMRDAKQINAFWTLRKRSVGLLGNLPGRRKPIAFVEDTVVPPERLRDFVREFRAILDDAGFTYGMFGHVDVGCLHVRPALDLKDERDADAVRRISDAVARLVRRYGGIIWGEHGKGVRGEYNPMFFGDVIYGAMREVKAAFDPRGQLNPGKIATPTNSTATLLTIDTEMRGRFDRQITPPLLERFDDAVRCNGNGQCHNDHADVVMCPSWKETRDRRHTPKGRAALMREWLRLLSNADATFDPDAPARGGFLRRRLNAWRREPDFSHEVLDAMRGCLACKACAGQCPVKVDVPDFRAEFLQAYHDRYPRPLRDRLVAGIESALPRAARVAGLANVLTHLAPARLVGLVDAPVLATPTLAARLRDDPARRYDVGALSANSVVIVPDAFSTFYTPQVVVALIAVIRALGFEAMLMPYFVNGKSMHVKGFTRRFRTIVRRNVPRLRAAAATGATLVGIDPAVTLTYRDEYRRALGADPGFRVLMVQEWLGEALAGRPARPVDAAPMRRLFMHCTERALTPTSMRQWADACARLGAPVEVVDAGCCGMCGAYGHERDHVEQSRGIYARSWARHLGGSDLEHLATGYSCRSQVKRIDGVDLRHPIEVLADALRGEAS
ncbi:MAG: hypothetical protein KDA25_12815, partial [Phycisphaerales bacterium]|nr:hypothetical protein [Phycisphaerales bacterium]